MPDGERQRNAQWRPDRVVDAAVSWADHLEAMQPVDRACVFGLRFKGGELESLRSRHASELLRVAKQAEAELVGPAQQF